MRLRNPEYGARALDAATAGAGAELVGTQQEVIEILRNSAKVIAMGARVLTGLTGPVPFPKQTGTGTAYWVGENPPAGVTESQLGTGLVTLAPKSLMSKERYSRQLMMEASVDTEALVRNDLGANHGLAVDRAALHGEGAAGVPTGIYVATDVLIVAMGGVPDYGKLIDMQGKVQDANAMAGTLGYMTTSLMASVFKQTLEASAAGARWIWSGKMDDGEVAGYRATSTNQVRKDLAGGAEHGIIFGNWGDMILGLWNAMELVVDPYTQADKAMIVVTSFQMADVILRHGQSFCKATGATIA
jgi:HK97 family phage major capsid protein